MSSATDTPRFEIGLVMAGAVSAGAYTAGVVDFLVEALDAWEGAQQRSDFAGPRHDVLIRTLAGASAGGMTSAIAAVALQSQSVPVRDVDNPPPPESNRLYESWVRRIDVTSLLAREDIDKEGRVTSLLDSSELARIAESALHTQTLSTPRRYVADPLAVFLTVANLRGVPYGFSLISVPGARPYGMLAHADHMRFSVSRLNRSIPGARLLDPASKPGDNWPGLALAALATGAFPIGLKPRRLERPHADFVDRFAFPPMLPTPLPADPYIMLCVDGGLMNNEPLELARTYLSGGADKRNPQEGTRASRAVIMIDPFPNTAALNPDYKPGDGLLTVAGKMFGALINQARFKPEELSLAADDKVYSRFMIAPSRTDAQDNSIEPAMASAVLDGFGGFLSQAFRRHDFQLGRRNCQNFLRRHFCLPENNPLFDSWRDPASRDRYYVRDGSGNLVAYTTADPTRMLPIIPLMPDVAGEIPLYTPPRATSVDMNALEKLIDSRLKAVAETLIDTDLAPVIGGSLARWLARTAFNLKIRPKLRAKACSIVQDELRRLH